MHAYKFKTAVDSHATSCQEQNLFEENVSLSLSVRLMARGEGGEPGVKL